MQLLAVKGYDSFGKIYRNGVRIKHKSLLAVFSERERFPDLKKIDKVTPELVYYGVSAGKRLSKKAVIRNRIKRLLRESLRLVLSKKHTEELQFDVILLNWMAPISHPKELRLKDVLPLVEEVIERFGNYKTSDQK